MSDFERTVLFLCVANSARSQLAESIGRYFAPTGTQVFSAGSEPSRVHPLARQALDEINLRHENQHSKPFDDIDFSRVTDVITLCAEENCPYIPSAAKRYHWPFPDPAAIAQPEKAIDGFRHVRDMLIPKIRDFLASNRELPKAN
ncbi:MAG: arsenate reductase ArsC [Bradymonadia bacterium]